MVPMPAAGGSALERNLRFLVLVRERDKEIELEREREREREREILLSKKPLAFYEIGSSIGGAIHSG